MSVESIFERDPEVRRFNTVARSGTINARHRLVKFRQNKIRTRGNFVDRSRRERAFVKSLCCFDSSYQVSKKRKQHQYPAHNLVSQQLAQPIRNTFRIDRIRNFVQEYLPSWFGRK